MEFLEAPNRTILAADWLFSKLRFTILNMTYAATKIIVEGPVRHFNSRFSPTRNPEHPEPHGSSVRDPETQGMSCGCFVSFVLNHLTPPWAPGTVTSARTTRSVPSPDLSGQAYGTRGATLETDSGWMDAWEDVFLIR